MNARQRRALFRAYVRHFTPGFRASIGDALDFRTWNRWYAWRQRGGTHGSRRERQLDRARDDIADRHDLHRLRF